MLGLFIHSFKGKSSKKLVKNYVQKYHLHQKVINLLHELPIRGDIETRIVSWLGLFRWRVSLGYKKFDKIRGFGESPTVKVKQITKVASLSRFDTHFSAMKTISFENKKRIKNMERKKLELFRGFDTVFPVVLEKHRIFVFDGQKPVWQIGVLDYFWFLNFDLNGFISYGFTTLTFLNGYG